MKLCELKTILRRHPDETLRIVLPDGGAILADFHITEVGHSVKNFIDCGGTVRSSAACVLQTWIAANDRSHRLKAGKLASILDFARKVVPSDDLEVEVEYEADATSQYPLAGAEFSNGEVVLTLASKHTDCLARSACGLEPAGCGDADEACGCCAS